MGRTGSLWLFLGIGTLGVIVGIGTFLLTPRPSPGVVQEPPLDSTFEQLKIQFHPRTGPERKVVVRAARGVPGQKRIGFLQTALMPTLELKGVTIERTLADGTVHEDELPSATLDWATKNISE